MSKTRDLVEPKPTIKATRMVAVGEDFFEVRDQNGLLATDSNADLVVYRVDGDARAEVGRVRGGSPQSGADLSLLETVMTKWFRK